MFWVFFVLSSIYFLSFQAQHPVVRMNQNDGYMNPQRVRWKFLMLQGVLIENCKK